jgi:hypothetical protein
MKKGMIHKGERYAVVKFEKVKPGASVVGSNYSNDLVKLLKEWEAYERGIVDGAYKGPATFGYTLYPKESQSTTYALGKIQDVDLFEENEFGPEVP